MRKAPVPLPAAPTPLEVLRDVLLFQGDYAFAYYIFLALYCAACCRNLKEALPRLTWFYAIPLAVLTSFGGGIMVPVLLGLPAAPLINEALIPTMMIAWACVQYLHPVLALLQSPFGRAASNSGFEVFRYHVLAICSDLASRTLPPVSTGPLAGTLSCALVGPLLCGMIGGCGGAFMPLSNGLKALEGSTIPWRVQSSAVMSAWHHLLTHDAAVRASAAEYVPFLADPAMVKLCGILFFAGLPALQQLGLLPAGLLGPNPFVINAAKVKRA